MRYVGISTRHIPFANVIACKTILKCSKMMNAPRITMLCSLLHASFFLFPQRSSLRRCKAKKGKDIRWND